MNHDDDRDPFEGLRGPCPPGDLEARVLRAATAALDYAPTIWDRLWESRPLRATWGVATAGLIIANIAVSFPRDHAAGPPVAESPREEVEKIRDALGFHPVEIGPRAEALVMGSGSLNDVEPEPREASRDSEVKS